jgi:3-oxoacyl-[acyl-carrier protein] reductase
VGRVVLVTGGNRGIGLAVAQAFVAAGDRVAITSRSGETPAELAGADVLVVTADVTDSASIDAAFDAVEAGLGPVEVVVANAGITRDTLILRMSDDDIDAVIDTNLVGCIRVARRAAKGMLRQRKGRIILMSSVVGLMGSAGQANYSASKAGLVGLARSLARELGSRGITANVVAPGFVVSDMTDALPEERRAEIVAHVPLGRYASPDEVAGVCVFLAGDAAAYITGAVIPVDGGLGMGH